MRKLKLFEQLIEKPMAAADAAMGESELSEREKLDAVCEYFLDMAAHMFDSTDVESGRAVIAFVERLRKSVPSEREKLAKVMFEAMRRALREGFLAAAEMPAEPPLATPAAPGASA